MYICGFLCVHGWVANDGILSPAFLKRCQIVQKTFLCLYWHKDHTKCCDRENLWDRKRMMKDVNQSGAEGQSVKSETPRQSVRSETPEQRVSQLGARLWSRKKIKPRRQTRWVSIFGCCVGFSLSSHYSHEHRMLKSAYFTFLRFAVLNPFLSVSSFHTLLFVILFFFVQLVKCPHSLVWEETMESTLLDEWQNQQNPPFVGCFIVWDQ